MIRKSLPILLFYSHVSGGISEAFSVCTCHEVALKPATGLCTGQSRHIVFCVFCCVTFYLVALHFTLSLNNDIKSCLLHFTAVRYHNKIAFVNLPIFYASR